MGFMDKMKAANGMNLGHIESPDFPNGVLVIKDKQLTIINSAMNGENFEEPVRQSDVKIFKLIGCGGSWAKYYLELNNGKCGVITQDVITEIQRQQSGAHMPPIERFLKLTDVVSNFSVVAQDNTSVIKEQAQVCPKCGAPIDKEMLFCGECGEKLK